MTVILALLLGLSFGTQAETEAQAETEESTYDGDLIIENGLPQPMLNMVEFNDPYVNEEDNGILRFCVYVETDNDTDNDGKADLRRHLHGGRTQARRRCNV